MISVAAIGVLSNTLSIETGDLRKGSAFDRVKATFNQALKLGELPASQLTAEYDSGANRDFLESATLTGALIEPQEAQPAKGRQTATDASDLSVTYEVSHDFASKKTDLKLAANTNIEGTRVGVKMDDKDGVTEVSAERDIQGVTVEPSWRVKAKSARVKLMSKLGDNDKLSAQIDHTPDGGATTYEVSYDRQIEEGRDLSATVDANGKTVEVDYVDSKTEDGATWTASASMPIDSGKDVMDDVKLSLKRAWKW
jgi:hypothetical protein